jgi:hypothetical protein
MRPLGGHVPWPLHAPSNAAAMAEIGKRTKVEMVLLGGLRMVASIIRLDSAMQFNGQMNVATIDGYFLFGRL